MSLGSAEAAVGGPLLPRGGGRSTPPSEVMLRSDALVAYPCIGAHPVLMSPEALTPHGEGTRCDMSEPRFSEAYRDRRYYADLIDREHPDLGHDATIAQLCRLDETLGASRQGLPFPVERWMERSTTVGAAVHAYEHLAPAAGARFLQIGGRGTHAIKFLLAGAGRAVVVSPVVDELDLALLAADRVGVADRLATVCALAEQLPLPDSSVDLVFSGSSIHHTVTDEAFPEIARVMSPGGRFASIDVFRSPLYRIGTRVFGRATRGAGCRPLDDDRLGPALAAFDDVELAWHGRLARYPIAVLARARLLPSVRVLWQLERAERAVHRVLPSIDRLASLVVVTATTGGPVVGAAWSAPPSGSAP